MSADESVVALWDSAEVADDSLDCDTGDLCTDCNASLAGQTGGGASDYLETPAGSYETKVRFFSVLAKQFPAKYNV